MQMGVIPVSTRRMVLFNLVLVVKFFFGRKFQENIVAIALRADPEAMSVQIGGIKTMWFISISSMMFRTGGCLIQLEAGYSG